MTKKELLKKIKLVEPENDEQRNQIVCSLIGHSKIQTTCFGYYYCGRCGDQVGDTLGSSYPGVKDVVIVDHDCPTCHDNYDKCTWKDKLFVPNPFNKKGEKP